jgi:ribose 5-phosphate isomerase B
MKVGEEIQKDPENVLGVLVCGSGIGISIAANKMKGVRCGLCHDYYTAQMAKTKDNCNAIAMGERVIGKEVAL